jgi:hypothetical protein
MLIGSDMWALYRYPVKSMGGERLESPSWAGTASKVTGRHSGGLMTGGSLIPRPVS